MSKHLNPLEKEFLIRQYKSNYRIKMSDFCEANHISTGAFQKWIKQYDEGGLEGLARADSEIKDVLPEGIDRTEESYKREILKLRIENERLKKLCRADDGYWGTGVHSFKDEEFEIVELLSRDYEVQELCSLMGVSRSGYGKEPKSVPVGSETVIDIYPLDFEEFLWANGISEPVIAMLQKSLDAETPVPEALHNRMRQLLLQYAVEGGMPDAVQTFVDSKQMDEVLRIQRDIVRSYEDDMVKYAEKKDKSRIKECFQSIPRQLAKENKKFQYSVVRRGSTAAKYAGSLQWIENAGIIARCYNLSITELPLDGNAEEDTFKVYMRDMGLFVSMLEDGTQYDILQGNLYGYKGAIFENLIADIFTKMGRKLYYFHKDSGLEVDFVIRYKGECTLVEVKATTGNVKSTKTILKHPEKYHVENAIKLGDYNVGRMGQILTLPLYMAFLLRAL